MMGFSPQKTIPLAAAFLLVAVQAAVAGTWSSRQWLNDGDIPQPAPEMVTHAIAFGIATEPPTPAPYERTKEISGEKWMARKFPDLTGKLEVDDRNSVVLRGVSGKDDGLALLRGRIFPKGRGGLSLELSGLEPGHNYSLTIFGLGFATPGGKVMACAASDAPGQVENFKTKQAGDDAFMVYDYTAPADGKLAVTFESAEGTAVQGKGQSRAGKTNKEGNMGEGDGENSQVVRFCAFLNQKAE